MFESDEAAAEALASSVQSDQSVDSYEQAEQAAAVTDGNDAGTADAEVDTGADSFTSIDPDTLPDELRPLWQQLQGDYTRKTQEIAPFRKLGVSPDEVRQALDITRSLQDPAIQKQLYDRLSEQYAGEFDGGFEDEVLDDPRDRQLTELSSRLEAFERRQVETEISAELDRAEAVIRSSNPTWDDGDIESVAQLALSHQGDMLAAAETYKALNDRFINRHLSRKAQVPAGTPSASGHAQVPAKFASLDDAHKAAMQALSAGLAD